MVSIAEMLKNTDPTLPPVIVYGGGGHGKTLIEAIQVGQEFQVLGVIDDGLPVGLQLLGVPVLGGEGLLPELLDHGVTMAVNGVGGIGNPDARWHVFELLQKAGFNFPTIIHPTAYLEPSAKVTAGVQVLGMAYVGTQVNIGFGSVVNIGAILPHDCQIGQCVNLSPGVMLAGNVSIADFSQVGMGATINLNIMVGEHVRIGNNATIKSDVPDRTVVRAGTIWPLPLLDHLGTLEE